MPDTPSWNAFRTSHRNPPLSVLILKSVAAVCPLQLLNSVRGVSKSLYYRNFRLLESRLLCAQTFHLRSALDKETVSVEYRTRCHVYDEQSLTYTQHLVKSMASAIWDTIAPQVLRDRVVGPSLELRSLCNS